MTPGDVVWVDFPGGAGRAQAGRRPAIVVQGAAATQALPTVLLVPLTTQQDALRFPGTVAIAPDAGNGIRRPSVALVFQLTAIDKKFLGAVLGNVGATVLQEIWTSLDSIMDRASASP